MAATSSIVQVRAGPIDTAAGFMVDWRQLEMHLDDNYFCSLRNP
jgi:hypothetical protein